MWPPFLLGIEHPIPTCLTVQCNIYDITRRSGQTRNLSDLVVYARFMHATDPRDMVHGLLGLSEDARAHPALVPDYSTSTTQMNVDQKLVEYSIQIEKSLDLICMRRRYVDPSWPSWVPDGQCAPGTTREEDIDIFPRSDMIQGSNIFIRRWVAGMTALMGTTRMGT
jgi:hypothetical protein